MAIKVSVVVPVYNPGTHIEACIESLLRQSLPPEEFEAIFVDDGSTDQTPRRLDELAAEHHNFFCIHQENSGWSGKPRNVGVDAARGEYVFFVDNDDWIGDEALERMYAYGKENDADIVIGKMAGKGRGVPRVLFERNRPRATLENAPLIDSLTPHKMFRKSFLVHHGLRFPEGRRRLEDHVFVTAAFFAAENISVLSDYVCYYHVRRDDATNAGFQRLDPKGYFGNLKEALDIVEANTEPGALRDRLYRRWYRVEMVERLRGRSLLAMPPAYRKEMFDEIRALSTAMFGPGVAAGMAPSQRVVSTLLRAGRLEELLALARWENGIRARAELTGLRWRDGVLVLRLRAGLRDRQAGLAFATRDGADVVDPPLPATARAVVSAADLATGPLERSRVEVLVRDRASQAEFRLPACSEVRRVPLGGAGRFAVAFEGEATVDPLRACGGDRLPEGLWDLVVRVRCCGWTKDSALGAAPAPRAGAPAEEWPGAVPAARPGGSPGVVVPYLTGRRALALDVGQQVRRHHRDLFDQQRVRVRADGEVRLRLRCAVLVDRTHTDAAVRLVHADSERTVEVPAVLEPAAGSEGSVLTARVRTDRLATGSWQARARLGARGHGPFVPTGQRVVVPGRRSLVGRGLRAARRHARATRRRVDGLERGARPLARELTRLVRSAGRRVRRRLGSR